MLVGVLLGRGGERGRGFVAERGGRRKLTEGEAGGEGPERGKGSGERWNSGSKGELCLVGDVLVVDDISHGLEERGSGSLGQRGECGFASGDEAQTEGDGGFGLICTERKGCSEA
eukprot:gnl/Ergobibamus_cyprinoides/4161.p2 GENE.gnl/Ergobibamus_cyprinoides/4161~~gnl/Ergobibamus_cyprinoides/4161.p2  ORF type:complete len:115 (-),score=18.32 gnl/Ergobibamus_cyprinoides/4161:43-387(-)